MIMINREHHSVQGSVEISRSRWNLSRTRKEQDGRISEQTECCIELTRTSSSRMDREHVPTWQRCGLQPAASKPGNKGQSNHNIRARLMWSTSKGLGSSIGMKLREQRYSENSVRPLNRYYAKDWTNREGHQVITATTIIPEKEGMSQTNCDDSNHQIEYMK